MNVINYIIVLLIVIIISTIAVSSSIVNDQKKTILEKDAKISEITNLSTEITNDNNKLKAEISKMKPLYLWSEKMINDGNSCYISVCTGNIETYNGKEGMVVGFDGDNDMIIQKDGTMFEAPRIEARQKRV